MIKIFDDKVALCVVIEDQSIQDFFYNDLLAYEDNGKISVLSAHNSGRLVFYQRAYTDFITQNEEAAGSNVAETINYLNLQFRGLGEVGSINITSANSSTAISGVLYNFQLTTDKAIRYWSESGLPEGLHLEQTSGNVSGITINTGGSPFTVNFAAIGATDTVTQSHTLNVITPPSFINNYSCQFTKANYSYCTASNNANLFFQKDEVFSISLWFKLTGNNGGTLYSRLESDGNGFILGVDKTGNNRNIIVKLVSDSDTIEFEGSTNLTASTWYHVILTYSGSETLAGLNLYLNGVVETKQNTNEDTLSTDWNQTGSLLYIGAEYSTTPLPANPITAIIDGVSLYNTVLSSGNVTTIYNSGIPSDLSQESFYSDVVEWCRVVENGG